MQTGQDMQVGRRVPIEVCLVVEPAGEGLMSELWKSRVQDVIGSVLKRVDVQRHLHTNKQTSYINNIRSLPLLHFT